MTKGPKDKRTKGKRDKRKMNKRTKGQKDKFCPLVLLFIFLFVLFFLLEDKRNKGKKDKWTKGQKSKRAKGQKDKRYFTNYVLKYL